MLPKNNRLKDSYDFRQVRRRGSSFKTPFYNLYFLKNSNQKDSRFGFVVSKRIDKRAAGRNRLTRVIREVVRQNLDKFPAGHDFVFYLKRASLDLPFKKLEKSVIRMLGQVFRVNG